MTGMPEHWEVYFSTMVFSVNGTVPGDNSDSDAEPGAVAVMSTRSPQAADSTTVVNTIARFHAALAAGDSATALGLLAEDVVILETGGLETKAQYRSGHLNGDMAYAKAVPSARTVTGVHIRGDAAWVTSTSITQGEYRERPVNSQGAELAVLAREGGAWKIKAIHWSSRARRAP
jgi:ketosteroid isomerase-like protein